MNTYLLHMLGILVKSCVITVFSFFQNTGESTLYAIKENNELSPMVVNKIIPYETIYEYNEKMPYNIMKVISEGKNGLGYEEDGNLKVLVEAENARVEKGTGAYGEFSGIITGYGPDCKTGCTGILYCPTKAGKYINLYDGIYYEDEEYGTVRILAAAVSKFPCGTIMEVKTGKGEPFLGIVMDTGSAMRNALKKGVIHIDVAFETERDPKVSAMTDFSGNVKYSVQRWGY